MSEVIFEVQDYPEIDNLAWGEVSDERKEIAHEFLMSGYFLNGILNINRFLDRDKTIDVEKLEFAVSLIVEMWENSAKIKNPIYVFLGNMDLYYKARGVGLANIDRITEEAQFILGFCQAIADEESINKEIIFQFRGRE